MVSGGFLGVKIYYLKKGTICVDCLIGGRGGGIVTQNEGLIRYRKVFVQVLNYKKNNLLRFFMHWVLLVFLRAKKRWFEFIFVNHTHFFRPSFYPNIQYFLVFPSKNFKTVPFIAFPWHNWIFSLASLIYGLCWFNISVI